MSTVHFVIDDAYLREFHAEMVATRLTRWRLHQRMARISVLLGALGLGLSVTTGRVDGGILALVVIGLAAGMLWRLHRRRERWLRYQRRLPTYGARVTTVLDDGRLLQSSDRNPDVLAIRTGEVLESRRGWFVTYDTVHLGTEVTDEAVSTERSSAYLPESGFESAISRNAFADALAGTFTVRRL